MKFIVIKIRKAYLFAIIILIILIFSALFIFFTKNIPSSEIFMGGSYSIQTLEVDNIIPKEPPVNFEDYIRPSKLPILNTKIFNTHFFYENDEAGLEDIKLPESYFKLSEDMLLNYFSVLRSAANPAPDEITGCGTIGSSKLPYPTAYSFLSTAYKEKLPYKQYLESFEGILHLSLIKLKKIPVYNIPRNTLRYFVEFETIEGSKTGTGRFAYYYGFIDVMKEKELYKISDMKFTGESYLCAPMHGWDYRGEAVVDIKYGNWCSLVKERYPTRLESYVKKIYFKGTDGNDYLIEFYKLTNDTDVEIAQYKKDSSGNYELIKLEPEKCLENRN